MHWTSLWTITISEVLPLQAWDAWDDDFPLLVLALLRVLRPYCGIQYETLGAHRKKLLPFLRFDHNIL